MCHCLVLSNFFSPHFWSLKNKLVYLSETRSLSCFEITGHPRLLTPWQAGCQTLASECWFSWLGCRVGSHLEVFSLGTPFFVDLISKEQGESFADGLVVVNTKHWDPRREPHSHTSLQERAKTISCFPFMISHSSESTGILRLLWLAKKLSLVPKRSIKWDRMQSRRLHGWTKGAQMEPPYMANFLGLKTYSLSYSQGGQKRCYQQTFGWAHRSS